METTRGLSCIMKQTLACWLNRKIIRTVLYVYQYQFYLFIQFNTNYLGLFNQLFY